MKKKNKTKTKVEELKSLKKRCLWLTIVLIILVFVALGMNKVWGQTEVKTVCEDKKGNLFVPRDRNGNIDTCKKHSESVTFNFGTGNGGETAIQGEIAFISDANSLLKKDGTVWRYDDMDNVWRQDNDKSLPSQVKASDVVQWSRTIFIVKNGDVWILGNGWQKFNSQLTPVPTQ